MKTNLAFYRKVFDEVAGSDPRPLYLLKGEESFIMDELARRIADRHVSEEMRSFNLTVEHGDEMDMASFVAAARSYPFLADRRVLVIRELERLRGGWKPLLDYCREPNESSIVVFLLGTHD